MEYFRSKWRSRKGCYKGDGQPVPLLRGHLHVIAMYALIAVAPHLLYRAPDGISRAGLAIGLIQSIMTVYTSALGHTTYFQDKRIHDRVFAVDHANIFILMAAGFTSLAANGSRGSILNTILVWVACYLASLKCILFGTAARKDVTFGIAMLLSCILVFGILNMRLNASQVLYGILGGTCALVGTICWALEYPNPIEGIYGYHEIHHTASLFFLYFYFKMILDMFSTVK